MHHYYTRRIVIALVSFFTLLALLFGPLVVSLRSNPAQTSQLPPADTTGQPSQDGVTDGSGITLPDGQTAFDNLCASCHKAQAFVDDIAGSLDPDATSLAQLEKLIGPPAHGGASPAEALAVVIQLRTQAGLPSTYPGGVPTPPAAATAAAAEPTATPLPAGAVLVTEDYAGVWRQICADCHRAERFIDGLKAEDDPDLRTWQAIEYLSGPPPHYNRAVESFLPAMNYIRVEAGLEPLIP